jgi:3,5-epimerase/4-reductase
MFQDKRGKLIFPIKQNSFKNTKECIVSINNKNVFRGIHLEQYNKLVTCIQGKILDIIINFNENEEDYLRPQYFILDPTTDLYQIIINKNYGHAFLALTDSILLYHYDDCYDETKTITINYKDPTINIQIPINNPIISDKDINAPLYKKFDYYIFGGKGFIGSIIVNEIQKNNTVYVTKLRLEKIDAIEKELDLFKPKYLISSAGITGNPNISWCEMHKTETIETNIIYQMMLISLCKKRNIHCTIIGSGVIFKNDKYYNEDDEGNFYNNFYSKCRIFLENMCKNYDNVLYLRINYPISSIKSNKNLITKLLTYNTIEDKEITLTYLDELIPYLIHMIENGEIGICNFVNDGSIKLNKILDLYSEIKEHKYTLSKNTDKNKSSSLLNICKLQKYNIKSTETAVKQCVSKYILLNN